MLFGSTPQGFSRSVTLVPRVWQNHANSDISLLVSLALPMSPLGDPAHAYDNFPAEGLVLLGVLVLGELPEGW